MSLTVQVQSTAASTGGTIAITVGPFSVAGSIAPQIANGNLVSGNNSFTVPTSSVGVVVIPPTTNAIVLKVKTTSGDTGINIPQANPSMFIFDTSNAPSTVYVNAASNTTGQTQLLFF